MKRSRYLLKILLFACLAGSTGCATYWKDRAADVADIGQLNGGLTMSGDPMPFIPSLFVSAKATRYGTIALGWEWGEKVGWYGRHARWWSEMQWGIPFVWKNFRLKQGMERRRRGTEPAEGTITWALSEHYDLLAILPTQHCSPAPWDRSSVVIDDMMRPIRRFDVSAEVALLYVSLRAGISPGEILDFLGGWFLIDLAGDDSCASPPETAQSNSFPRNN